MLKNLVVVLVVVLMFVAAGMMSGCGISHSTRLPRLNLETHSRFLFDFGETEVATALSGDPNVITEVVKKDNKAPDPALTPRSAVTGDGGASLTQRTEKALGM